MDTLPPPVLKEGNAVILKDQRQNAIVIFSIANEDADFPVTIAFLPYQTQDIGGCCFELYAAVGRLHQPYIFRLACCCLHLPKQPGLQPFQLRIMRPLILRQQGNRLPKARLSRGQFLH